MTILELLKAGRERILADTSNVLQNKAEVTLLGAIIEEAAEKMGSGFSKIERDAADLLIQAANRWDHDNNGGADVSQKERRVAIYDLVLSEIGVIDAESK